MDEESRPEELDRLIESVVTAEDPYEAAREVSALASEFLTTSEEASAVYLVWVALEDRYELTSDAEDARTFALMRRAATEWATAKDNAATRAEYLDRWQYDELGYERRGDSPGR